MQCKFPINDVFQGRRLGLDVLIDNNFYLYLPIKITFLTNQKRQTYILFQFQSIHYFVVQFFYIVAQYDIINLFSCSQLINIFYM